MAPMAGHAVEHNGTSPNGDLRPNPHPGRVILSRQYVPAEYIERQLLLGFSDPAKEITYRFEGVNFIESIVNVLQMPIRTFDAACTFWHKFRLIHGVKDYAVQDAALACLFVACKCEDTLKKSRDLLCAAYNLRNSGDMRTPDDKMFEKPSSVIIGIERLVLEAIAFDFRVRYPQKALVKILKRLMTRASAGEFYEIAFNICADMYKTYLPLKQTTFAMALTAVELAYRITGFNGHSLEEINYEELHVPRSSVRQGLLDMLELYTQHHKQTRLGSKVDLDKLIRIKIDVNAEVEDAGPDALPICRRQLPNLNDLHSVPVAGENSATNRFVFNADEARHEQTMVQQYFEDEYEEIEIEVEETIIEPNRPREQRRGGQGHGGFRGGHGHAPPGGPGRRGPDGWGGGGRRDNRRRRGGGFY
ncbi:hypothetical protein BX600DRAFT_445623 [Xylariales sp. PMI_506]|nr:hypothetical protein BX600DRAFT_445623 [Xylariales sp. PMI_506]